MTNMYQVVDTHGHKVVAEGFANRESAKVERDTRNGDKPDGIVMSRYIVSRGSDHPDGSSNGINTKIRGKNSRF